MNKVLLLLFLFLTCGTVVTGQTSIGYTPSLESDFVWVSVQSGDWADPDTWEYRSVNEWRPEDAGPRTCFWPGCTESPQVPSPDQTVLIRSGHVVMVSTSITFGSYIRVASGGAIYLVNVNGSATGRLAMPYDYAQIYLEPGSDIQSLSADDNTNDDNSLNAAQLQIGPPNNQANGGKINLITAPALLTANNLKDCGNGYNCDPGMGTLPVDLLTLEARAANRSVELSWTVAQEINFSHYIIEWSADGLDYTEAGQVMARGVVDGSRSYNYQHQPQQTGLLYYRLLAVDVDGTIAEKGLRTVNLGHTTFTAYALNGRLHVEYSGPEASQLVLLDTSGRVMATITNLENGIETVSFKAGIYLLHLNNSLEQKTRRVMIP
ncbi:MAG: T9SS type A sorting domain-containing protein [Bacteroidetes bacterium]|nr:T9SS type A sorting domain-containing protein [Bacteroidota bacterium]